MPISTIICDVMGVLLLRTQGWETFTLWEERLGLANGALALALFDSELDRAAVVGQVSQRELFQHACLTLGLCVGQLDEFEQELGSTLQLNNPLAYFLNELRPRHRVALLSNAWSEARRDLNRLFRFDEFVDLQIYSAEVGLAKPDERIFLLALERLGIQPSEALFLDDRLENIEAAQRLGLHAILFEQSEQAISELQKYLDRQESY